MKRSAKLILILAAAAIAAGLLASCLSPTDRGPDGSTVSTEPHDHGITTADPDSPAKEPVDPYAEPAATKDPGGSVPDATPVVSDSMPSSLPARFEMSYDEYFGEVRDFFEDDLYMREGNFDLDEDGVLYRDVGHGREVISDNVSGGWNGFCEIGGDRALFITDSRYLYLYDGALGHSALLYDAEDGCLHYLFANNYIAYFSVDTNVYRLFIPDNRVDFIVDSYYDSSGDIVVDISENNPMWPKYEEFICSEEYMQTLGGGREWLESLRGTYVDYTAAGTRGFFFPVTNVDIKLYASNMRLYDEQAASLGYPDTALYVVDYINRSSGFCVTVFYNAPHDRYAAVWGEPYLDTLGVPEEKRMTQDEYYEAFFDIFRDADGDISMDVW